MLRKILQTCIAIIITLLSINISANAEESAVGNNSAFSESIPFGDHVINGISPNGSTINLFDYWITNETDSDKSNPVNYINKGINSDHALIFGASVPSSYGLWNAWTHSINPRTGIVKNTLVDGYPELNLNTSGASSNDIKIRDGKESLAYLFDPSVEVEGKKSYRDIKNLLQVDKDGYYYYDSSQNYAAYYKNTNSFVLYEYPGIVPGGTSPVGQFFPFNEAKQDAVSYTYKSKEYTLMNTVKSTDTSINHYFGLHMRTRFINQYDGFADELQTKPVTYEFSGDDDVWVFIDNQLVADLGGIHDSASVKIDFSTGEITINGTKQKQTLGKLFGYLGDTLPNNTYHTLDFFYMERGNTDSNMSLRYNLITIPENNLIKIDQNGESVSGAEFTLYGAYDYEKNGTDATPISVVETDETGEVTFLDSSNFPITLKNLYSDYKNIVDSNGNNFILIETNTPPGYIKSKPVGLYFYESKNNPNEIMLLSSNQWETGSRAIPKVFTTLPNIIYESGNKSNYVTLTDPDTINKNLMFAVIFKKETEENGGIKWVPIYGDPVNGWNVESDNAWNNIIHAAQMNSWIFQVINNGSYQVEIKNLPGDIKTYYHVCKDENEAQYTIGYYYTTAKSLTQATESNTWRIESESFDSENDELKRVFSANIYISNIKNQFYVQKIDSTGNPVNGAEFSLYKEADILKNSNGTYQIKEGAEPVDSVTTSSISKPFTMDGAAIFPTKNTVLTDGTYYMIESFAPDGYIKNNNITKVFINDEGVFADAGTEDDGIDVRLGAGSILKSMSEYVSGEKINTTLQDIKMTISDFNGSDNSSSEELHLKFKGENTFLDYGNYEAGNSGIESVTLGYTSGMKRLHISQCFSHDQNTDTSGKTNLEDFGLSDISHLFSKSTIVRVVNEKAGNLKIQKTVTGSAASPDTEFHFKIKISGAENNTFNTVDQNGDFKTITFNNETADIYLKQNQSITIKNIPDNTEYEVSEEDIPEGFKPLFEVENDSHYFLGNNSVSGVISHQNTVVVNITNNFTKNAIVNIQGTKELKGKPFLSSDSFSFILEPNNTNTSSAINSKNIVIPSDLVTVIGNDKSSSAFSFNNIEIKTEGDYSFKVKELVSESSKYMEYDNHEAIVNVHVEKDSSTGILVPTITYDNTSSEISEDQSNTSCAKFTNTYKILTISKTVTGAAGDKDEPFTFQIRLTSDDGSPVQAEAEYVLTDKNIGKNIEGTISINGTGEFSLTDNQEITFYGLPDVHCQITEDTGNGYEPSNSVKTGNTTSENKSDTAEANLSYTEHTQIDFTNNRDEIPILGVVSKDFPILLGFSVSLVSIIFVTLIFKKRRNKINEKD